MKRECPYCGYGWFMRNTGKMELLKNGIVNKKCKKCGKEYAIVKEERRLYVRYNVENGIEKENIGTVGELA